MPEKESPRDKGSSRKRARKYNNKICKFFACLQIRQVGSTSTYGRIILLLYKLEKCISICPVQVRRWLGKNKISAMVCTTIKPQKMDALLSEIALVLEVEFGEGFASNSRVLQMQTGTGTCISKHESLPLKNN